MGDHPKATGPGTARVIITFSTMVTTITITITIIIILNIVMINIYQGVLTFQEKKFLLAVERGDVASTRYCIMTVMIVNHFIDLINIVKSGDVASTRHFIMNHCNGW